MMVFRRAAVSSAQIHAGCGSILCLNALRWFASSLRLASGLGMTTAQLAIAWLLRRKEVSCVICGATRPEHWMRTWLRVKLHDHFSDDTLETIETEF